MFRIHRRGTDRLEVRLVGFLGVADVEASAAFLAAAYNEMPAAGRGHRALIDTTGCVPQSQEFVRRIQTLVTECPPAARIAVVNTSGLVKLQLRRVLAGREDRVGFFGNRSEAERWLREEPMQPVDSTASVAPHNGLERGC